MASKNGVDLRHVGVTDLPAECAQVLGNLRGRAEADQRRADNRVAQRPAQRQLRQGLAVFRREWLQFLDRGEIAQEVLRAEQGSEQVQVILLSQLREVYIDAELEPVDTVQWYPKVMRKDFTVGLSVTEAGVDDPDQQFYENYACGVERNYTGYCSPEVDKLIDQQSMEPNQDKRKNLVWEIERRLAEDGARPVIFYPRGGNMPTTLGEGTDHHDKQHLQRQVAVPPTR